MNNMVTIAIADDDAAMRDIMRRLIEKSGGFDLVGEATDGQNMLALFDQLHPQAVVLDVEMPGMNGVDCARAIQDRDPHTVIIFSTAHEQYMQDAFELYAFDYLIKPFKLERALKTLDMVKERISQRAQAMQAAPTVSAARPSTAKLMLRHKEGLSVVNVDRIVLVQREERMTAIYTTDGKRYLTSDTLSEVEEKLPKELFFRTHKSYIVNVDQIDSITPYGRWTYIVKLHGITQDALITHEKFEELQRIFEQTLS